MNIDKSKVIAEFDLLTCHGFEELLKFVSINEISLDDDVVVILFRRLFKDYPPGTWDNRNAITKVAELIRMDMLK